MAKTPTLVDIARNLGISPISVSRAIRNAGHVSPELQKKILAEAKRIGYSPNPAARALRNKSSYLLGLIVPSFFSNQIEKLVTDIQDYSQQQEHGLILGITQWDEKAEIKQIEFMDSKDVDGIIIKSQGRPKAIKRAKELAKNGRKIVYLLDKFRSSKTYSVLVNNIHGGSIAAQHLLDNGHNNVCYVTYENAKDISHMHSHFSVERMNGFIDRYKAAGANSRQTPILYIDASPGVPFKKDVFKKALKNVGKVTAFLTYDDYLAAGLLKTLNREKISVPNDISIVGFDDSPSVSQWSTPPITVIKQPDKQIAFEAVNIILGQKSKSNACVSGLDYTVEPELIIRESVKNLNK